MVAVGPRLFSNERTTFETPLSLVEEPWMTVLGDAWTGEVVSTNDGTREITIRFQEKDRTDTFTGVLEDGYTVQMKDGTSHELRVSEIPNGTRIRLYTKTKDQAIGGRKVKVNQIFRIDFSGRDEFSRLRSALQLDPAIDVVLNQKGTLSATKLFMLFLAIEDGRLRQRFVNWTAQWNRNQPPKSGSIELVSDFTKAEAALVVLNGADMMLGPLISAAISEADAGRHEYRPVTVFLVTHKAGRLEVLWREVLLNNVNTKADKGRLEKEIEKRLKSR